MIHSGSYYRSELILTSSNLLQSMEMILLVQHKDRSREIQETIIDSPIKVESEKVGLKLNIQKTKIMASGPITSWEIDGETVSDFIFWGSKITTDGDFSHEMKRRYSLEEKL